MISWPKNSFRTSMCNIRYTFNEIIWIYNTLTSWARYWSKKFITCMFLLVTFFIDIWAQEPIKSHPTLPCTWNNVLIGCNLGCNGMCIHPKPFSTGQLKPDMFVDTLEIINLRRHHWNLSSSRTRQKQTGRQVLLLTPHTADSDCAKVTHANEYLCQRN